MKEQMLTSLQRVDPLSLPLADQRAAIVDTRSPDMLNLWRDSTDPAILEKVILHGKVSSELLKHIAENNKNNEQIINLFALQTKYPDEEFRVLAQGYDYALMLGCEIGRNLTIEQFENLYNRNNNRVDIKLVSNPNIPEEMLVAVLGRATTYEVFTPMLGRKNLSPPVVEALWDRIGEIDLYNSKFFAGTASYHRILLHNDATLRILVEGIEKLTKVKERSSEQSRVLSHVYARLSKEFKGHWKKEIIKKLKPDYPELDESLPVEWLEELFEQKFLT